MSSRPVIALWLVCASSLPGTTAELVRAGEEEADIALGEILISETRTPQLAHQLAGTVTLVPREQIDRSPYPGGHQIDDLLRSVPDVQPSLLSSRYNHPTAQAVSLRGLGTRRTLVLLDGVPLNDGFGGWINWGLVPDRVQRIEVVPGGASSLWGTWAMGGVIHIITEPAATDLGGN